MIGNSCPGLRRVARFLLRLIFSKRTNGANLIPTVQLSDEMVPILVPARLIVGTFQKATTSGVRQ